MVYFEKNIIGKFNIFNLKREIYFFKSIPALARKMMDQFNILFTVTGDQYHYKDNKNYFFCTHFFNSSWYKNIKDNCLSGVGFFIFQSVKTYTNFCQLDLNVDSTFTYTTCGSIQTGKWRSFNDSLFLFAETNRFRNDSLNDAGYYGLFPKVPKKPAVYKINKNKLLRFIMFDGNEKGLERLKLVSCSN